MSENDKEDMSFAELAKIIQTKNKKIDRLEQKIDRLETKIGEKKENESKTEKKERQEYIYECDGCERKFTESEFQTQDICPVCGSTTASRI